LKIIILSTIKIKKSIKIKKIKKQSKKFKKLSIFDNLPNTEKIKNKNIWFIVKK